MAKQTREYRNMILRALDPGIEETEEKRVEGYASTFNEPYVLYEDDWLGTDPQAPNQEKTSFSIRSIKLLPNMGPKFCPPHKTSLPSYSK